MSTLRAPVLAVMVVLASAGVAGCGSSSSGKSAPSSGAAAITGRTWVLDTARLLSGAGDVLASATFDGSRVSGENGCNRYSAPYTSDAAKRTMTIGPHISATQMACDGVRARVESAYMAALPKVATYEVTSNRLTLHDGSGRELLRYSASAPAEAIKGTWSVTLLYTGDALVSPHEGSTLTATFDGSKISGAAGCNTFSGTYLTEGDTITIGPLASTKRACADPAVDEQERHYLTALGLAHTFGVAGRRLDLFRADGGYAVSYTRAAEQG
ncbi:MAG: META domain-containing protein [Acidimicrobiia bacterium]